MVTKYGMSEKLGPIMFGTDQDEVFLGRDFSATPNYSEKIAAAIDDEIEGIITTQYQHALELLKAHMDKLHKVAEILFKKEKIDGEEFRQVMEDSGPAIPEVNSL